MSRPFMGLAVVAAALAVAAPAARADVSTQYFTLPAAIDAVAGGLAIGPDGTVYFGGGNGFNQTPSIGKLNPSQVVAGTSVGITGVVTPDVDGCCSSIFRDMSWSAKDNRLYWTRSDNLVGTLTAAGTVTTAPVPAAPWGIVAAPEGGAWLAENYSNNVGPAFVGGRIARVSSALGLSEYENLALQGGATTLDPLRYDAKPKGIDVGADGTPWFAEAAAGNPGYRLGTAKGASGYTEYPGPCFAASPCSGSDTGEGLTDVAVGKDGSVWYTNEISKSIGRFVPAGTMTEYRLANMAPGLGAGTPKTITTASDGSLWAAVYGGYSAPGANAIVHIVPGTALAAPTATVYKLGAANQPLNVAPDGQGNVWFTGTGGPGGGPIGRLGDVPLDPGTGDPGTGDPGTGDPGTGDPGTGDPGTGDPGTGDPGTGDPGTGGGGAAPTTTPAATPTTPITTTLVPSTVTTAKVTDPTVRGDSVNANQICVGPPQDRCSLIYLIQTHEYVTGFPNTHGYAAKAKQLTTVGTLKVTLKGGQKKQVTIKLNAKGKKLRRKMAFKATLTVTQSLNGAKPKTVLRKNLKFRK